MTTGHATDTALQQYALDPSGCTSESRQHIGSCESCQAELATYRLLFAGLKEQPGPVFDFNLADAVLSQLPALARQTTEPLPVAKSRLSGFGSSAWLLIALTFCTIGIPIYLFRKNIWIMFTQISGLFMYIILGAAAIIVISRIRSMYKKYQQQIDTLNFY